MQETLDGNISDLPNMNLYMHQLDKKENLKRDKNKFYLYYSTRGTNFIELCHKTLVSTYETWAMGIEYFNCLLIE